MPSTTGSTFRNGLKLFTSRVLGHENLRFRRLIEENRKLMLKEVELRRELEKTAASVRVEQDNLLSFVEQAPVAMCLLEGSDYRYTRTNAMYQALVGNRLVIGKRIRDEFPGLDARFFEALDRVYRTGMPFYGTDIEIGSEHLDFVYHPWLAIGGRVKGVLVAASDVSEKFAARKLADEMISKLRAERELRNRFVSALTHDMRTPLTGAKISAQLLGRKFDSQPEIQRGVGRIVRSIDRVDGMIRDLLDANQIEAGAGVSLSLSECNLTQLVKGTMRDLSEIHGERFAVNAPSGEIIGKWDRNALQRVLENLASNAIKYGSEKGPVTVSLSKENEEIKIAVHNEGPAISVEDQGVLFEHLRRTRSAQDGTQKGWGVGLTLVRGLAEAHGGSVKVESGTGQGTTFSVRIPNRSERLYAH